MVNDDFLKFFRTAVFVSTVFILGLAPFPHTFRVRSVSVPNRYVWPRKKGKKINRKKGKEAAEVASAPKIYLFFLNSSRAGAANLPCVVLLSVAFIKC